MRPPWEPIDRTGFERVNYDPASAMLISTLFKFGSQIGGGISQYNLANQQAGVLDQEAAAAIAASKTDAEQQQQNMRRQQAIGIANAGASGIDPNQGSPAAAASDAAGQTSLATQLTLYRGKLQAAGFRQQANYERYGGTNALVSGVIGAGSSLLTTYEDVTNPKSPRYSPQLASYFGG